jgi:hypothetical protein
MPDVAPIVFVVDDDVSVRESLELLIKSAGWQPETFASAREFLSRPRGTVPCCLGGALRPAHRRQRDLGKEIRLGDADLCVRSDQLLFRLEDVRSAFDASGRGGVLPQTQNLFIDDAFDLGRR